MIWHFWGPGGVGDNLGGGGLIGGRLVVTWSHFYAFLTVQAA